ncbi:uncharacterized protein TrAtP1_011901 [Trichoderma atroviride]|uniref:Stress-response A/B barrel domain-containing protein n=1 Tax=Hypocrea atroviridis (strain ATCC 20476 / IMI 206040) TaxID=452589 RepID=G9P5Z5_HYPAI|nr:uncharacterized protein TRIATDRAFT_84035 [Trichoderma atroviride IMI 206040]EHK42218.1 hypothetical protein TRIATDRAFT_84035 [Trichoderma atroviride IMI 206040]UKZ70933.1 hypothetical protein TrAtP1_011901 [Trichoderma atroviride]
MSVIHIVLFKYKSSATAEAVQNAVSEMLALKSGCLHPTTQTTYIKALTGGINNSPENLQNGFTHAFVVEFASVEDRDYYVDKDPIHEAFKTNNGPTIEKACVLDYTVGVFE